MHFGGRGGRGGRDKGREGGQESEDEAVVWRLEDGEAWVVRLCCGEKDGYCACDVSWVRERLLRLACCGLRLTCH